MENKETVLVFCAHSDDQVFGVGGTIAKYSNEGKEVYTYVFSYGESSNPWMKEKVLIEQRVKEAKDADKVLGGSGVAFFGLKEGNFFEDYRKKKLNERITEIIQEKKPSKIFIHSDNDPHPDHRAVYTIITSLIENIGIKCDVYSFDVWTPFKLRKRYEPSLLVDISKTFKKKIKALHCFKSQKIALITLIMTVYTRGFFNGMKARTLVAERFVKVK